MGTLFCAIAGSFETLLAARIFTGMFGGVIGSLSMTIVSDLFLPDQRGRAMSTVQMAFAASQILGVPLGLLIASQLNWHYTFLLVVLLSVLILVGVVVKLKPVNEHLKTRSDKSPFLHWWRTVKNKQHQTGFAATIVLGIGMMLQPFISIFLKNNIHVSDSEVPLVFMVTGAAAFFIMPLVGRLADKFDKFKIFLLGSSATVMIVPVYTHLPIVPLGIVLAINVVMFAVIMSRMGPYQALNSMVPKPADRGAYMSLSASLSQLSGGLGIVIAGSIVSQPAPTSPLQNFDVLGYVVAGLTLLACYLVHRVNKIAKANTAKKSDVQ